jgi:Transposase IS66 family
LYRKELAAQLCSQQWGLPTHRGRIRRRTGHNLLLRLRDHKEAPLRFLYDPTVPFTNNQAERDLRMMKVRQKISGGFRSETGAQTFATLRTVLSTARKQGWNILATLTTPPAVLILGFFDRRWWIRTKVGSVATFPLRGIPLCYSSHHEVEERWQERLQRRSVGEGN